MKVLILFFLLFSHLTWAQLQTERTVSRDLNVANAEEAKPYLLFKATDETIAQYATEMGFDLMAFRLKLNAKFEKFFADYKERQLTERFGKNYSEQLSPEQKSEFLKGLDSHRDREYMQFTRLNDVVESYSFKEIGADPKNPKLWTATVILSINRPKLDRLVKRTFSDQEKQYSRIYLLSEINLIGLGWNDLGLERSSSFTDPVMNSWGKWFSANLPSNVEEVTLCEGECVKEFTKWLELPQDEKLQVPTELQKALWIRLSFNVRKTSFIASLNEWGFEWEGSTVLIDAATKRVIDTEVLHTESKTWRGHDQKTLNSALASQIYRAPLAAFSSFTKKIVDTPQLNRVSRLVIQGQKNLGDVLSLMELLKKEGKNLNLELQLDLFSQKEAQLLCFYQGEEKSFSDLLSRPKELKSSQSYRLVNEFTGIHPLLKLVAE